VEISKLKHDLDSMNVRLIGVGFEKSEKDVYDFLIYPKYYTARELTLISPWRDVFMCNLRSKVPN
jgi:hypothetical protein